MHQETIGEGEEWKIVFMENRYFANSYTGKEAYISYIYLIGITSIAQGLNFGQILVCFRSLIPDSETEFFEKFASKWELCGKSAKKIGTVIQFGQKGE